MVNLKGEKEFRDDVAAQNAVIAAVKPTKGVADLIDGQMLIKQATNVLAPSDAVVAGIDARVGALEESMGDVALALDAINGEEV